MTKKIDLTKPLTATETYEFYKKLNSVTPNKALINWNE